MSLFSFNSKRVMHPLGFPSDIKISQENLTYVKRDVVDSFFRALESPKRRPPKLSVEGSLEQSGFSIDSWNSAEHDFTGDGLSDEVRVSTFRLNSSGLDHFFSFFIIDEGTPQAMSIEPRVMLLEHQHPLSSEEEISSLMALGLHPKPYKADALYEGAARLINSLEGFVRSYAFLYLYRHDRYQEVLESRLAMAQVFTRELNILAEVLPGPFLEDVEETCDIFQKPDVERVRTVQNYMSRTVKDTDRVFLHIRGEVAKQSGCDYESSQWCEIDDVGLYNNYMEKLTPLYDLPRHSPLDASLEDEVCWFWSLNAYTWKQKRPGGFFDEAAGGYIALVNDYARRKGYDGFADMQLRKLYGFEIEEYQDDLGKTLQWLGSRIESSIQGMRKYYGAKRPIHLHNYSRLHEEMFDQKLLKVGMSSMPTWSWSEAREIVFRFYADLGVDIPDLIEQGKILIDPYVRKHKYGGAWKASLGGGLPDLIGLNLARGKRLSFDTLTALVHECAHAVHGVEMRKDPSGVAVPAKTSGVVAEHFAQTLDRVVSSKAWIDRYLSGHPRLRSDRVRKLYAQKMRESKYIENADVLLEAEWEIQFYDERNEDGELRSMRERLDLWNKKKEAYFHFDRFPIPSSEAFPLYDDSFVKRPMYRSAYYLAPQWAEELMQSTVEAMERADAVGMQQGFEHVMQLMGSVAASRSFADLKRYDVCLRSQESQPVACQVK
jgi:Peptidase family M3